MIIFKHLEINLNLDRIDKSFLALSQLDLTSLILIKVYFMYNNGRKKFELNKR